jgi:hypothetical protein
MALNNANTEKDEINISDNILEEEITDYKDKVHHCLDETLKDIEKNIWKRHNN